MSDSDNNNDGNNDGNEGNDGTRSNISDIERIVLGIADTLLGCFLSRLEGMGQAIRFPVVGLLPRRQTPAGWTLAIPARTPISARTPMRYSQGQFHHRLMEL